METHLIKTAYLEVLRAKVKIAKAENSSRRQFMRHLLIWDVQTGFITGDEYDSLVQELKGKKK